MRWLNMKKILLIILSLFLLGISCNKNKDDGDDKDYNTLRITSGELEGLKYTYSPNQGFWAEAGTNSYYFHLVFGDTDNNTTVGQDVMSMIFYYEGQAAIDFPSAFTQQLGFGIKAEGKDYIFLVESARLTIYGQPTLDTFNGYLEGDFVDQADDSRKIHVQMDIRISMKMI